MHVLTNHFGISDPIQAVAQPSVTSTGYMRCMAEFIAYSGLISADSRERPQELWCLKTTKRLTDWYYLI